MPHSFKSLALFTALLVSPAIPAQASVLLPTCAPETLTPDERAESADLVFEGKVTGASCECHALASGEDSYGPEAACTDTVQVVKIYKGASGPEFVQKKMVLLDPDPKTVISHSKCEDLADDRNDKVIGQSHIYYVKQDGDRFETIPRAVCE